MSKLHKPLRDWKSNKLGEGPFFGPCLWDPENPQKPTVWDSHFLLVCCNECCVQVIASNLGCVHRLHKSLKISSKPKPPQGPHFLGPGFWDPENTKNTMFECLQCWWEAMKCCVQVIASDLGCVHRLHKPLKISSKSKPPPKDLIFGPWFLGPRKHEKKHDVWVFAMLMNEQWSDTMMVHRLRKACSLYNIINLWKKMKKIEKICVFLRFFRVF